MSWDTEDPFKQPEGEDFLGKGLHNIFNSLGGMDPKAMIARLMIQKLREVHKEIGELIDKFEIPGQKAPNPWGILGIRSTATQEEVKKAYRAKSATAHSDRGGTDEQQKLVNLAYELICQLRGWTK